MLLSLLAGDTFVWVGMSASNLYCLRGVYTPIQTDVPFCVRAKVEILIILSSVDRLHVQTQSERRSTTWRTFTKWSDRPPVPLTFVDPLMEHYTRNLTMDGPIHPEEVVDLVNAHTTPNASQSGSSLFSSAHNNVQPSGTVLYTKPLVSPRYGLCHSRSLTFGLSCNLMSHSYFCLALTVMSTVVVENRDECPSDDFAGHSIGSNKTLGCSAVVGDQHTAKVIPFPKNFIHLSSHYIKV